MDFFRMPQAELDAKLGKLYPTFKTPPEPTANDDLRTVTSEGMYKLAGVLNVPVIRVTYEVGGNEPLHPDPSVRARMREIGINNDCGFGCKVYEDPRSNVRVLAHNRAYGCPK